MKDMKYNPGFLTDDELVSSFRVRESALESILETLRGCTAESNTHMLVIGSRGSGKTTLLLRAAAEARRDPALSENLLPIVFPRGKLRDRQLRRVLAGLPRPPRRPGAAPRGRIRPPTEL